MVVGHELQTAVGLIHHGLWEVQPHRDNAHLMLLLLSSGLERMVKVMLCFDEFHRHQRWPTRKELKDVGHDLSAAIDRVSTPEFWGNLASADAGKADLAFLSSDQVFREIVDILTDFGKGGRYWYLDQAATPEAPADGPEHRWDALELALFGPAELHRLVDPSIHEQAHRRLRACIDRGVRALARWFTLSGNPMAKRWSAPVLDFVFLADEDLGALRNL